VVLDHQVVLKVDHALVSDLDQIAEIVSVAVLEVVLALAHVLDHQDFQGEVQAHLFHLEDHRLEAVAGLAVEVAVGLVEADQVVIVVVVNAAVVNSSMRQSLSAKLRTSQPKHQLLSHTSLLISKSTHGSKKQF
jgi:transcriptional regulator GlxA family with amidase domain